MECAMQAARGRELFLFDGTRRKVLGKFILAPGWIIALVWSLTAVWNAE